MKLSTPYECIPLQKVVYFQEGPGLRNWQYGTRGIPFLNIRTINSEGYIDKSLCQFVKQEEFEGKYEHFLLSAGDYVVSSSGTLGKLAEVRDEDLPLMLNTSVIRFRPIDEKELNRTYLKWFIKSPLYIRQIERASTGTAIKNYGPSHLKKMVIPLPRLKEQKRIAAILDKADAIRRKRKEAIALTEELLRSTFLDMFGDPIRNSKQWKTHQLGRVTSVNRGKFTPRPRNDPKYYTGDYPFIQTGDIASASGYLTEFSQTLNEFGVKVSRSFEPGSVVIAIVGATIGETAILSKKMFCPDSIIGIESNELLYPEFLEYTLRFWKDIFRAQAPATARANINLETLRPLPIALPPAQLQKDFAKVYQWVHSKKFDKYIETQDELFNSLLQKGFRGEL